jgi:hypothetical protein
MEAMEEDRLQESELVAQMTCVSLPGIYFIFAFSVDKVVEQ